MAARKRKKTDLAPVGQRLFDWSGGMNNAVNPALLSDNESVLLENYVLDEKGTIHPRKGSQNRYSSAFSSSPVAGMGAYYKSDGTSRLLVGTEDGKLFYDTPHLISSYDTQAEFNSGYKQAVQPTSDGKLWPMTVSTGFEDGSFADFHASDSGWTIDDTVCKSGAKSAKGSGTSQKLVREFGFNAGQVYVRLACRFAETNQRHYPVVFMSPTNTRIEAVVADSDGNFKYHDGTALTAFIIPKTYTADTWYTVEVWIRSGTFWVSIDGESLTPSGLALKDTSNAAQSQVAKLVIQNAGDATATMWVDDVMISLLDPVFSRSSVACKSDGTQVAVNQPRYEYAALPYPIWQDTFDTDQLATQYTSGGDSPATWTVSDGVLTGTGGTHATLIKNYLTLQDCEVVVNSDQAQDGGIIARYQDNNNYYLLALRDDSSAQNITIYKRVGGTVITLAYAGVAWPRGTISQIKFSCKGSTIEAYFNGVKVISVIDTTFTGGSVGLWNNSTIAFRVLDFTVYCVQQGVIVEEETTNLLTVAQSTGAGGLAMVGVQASKGTLTYITADGWEGGSCAQIVVSNFVAGDDVNLATADPSEPQDTAVSPDTTYTFSAYMKAPAGIGYNLRVIQWSSTGAVVGDTAIATQTGSGTRQRIVGTLTTTSTTAYVSLRIRFHGDGTFLVGGLQIEQKPYATSWTPGGSIRSAEVLTVPTIGVFQKGSWTVKLKYTPTSATDLGNRIKYLWKCYIDLDNQYDLLVGWYGEFVFRVKSGGTWYSINGGSTAVGDTYNISASSDGSKLRLFVNGVQIGTDTPYIEPVGSLPSNIYVGCSPYGEQANGIISDFVMMSSPQTLAEHQAEYYSGRPLQLDANTTYLLSCTGNLSPLVAYTWTSPVIDVSNAVDKASGQAALYADIPGGSTVAVQSRSASAPAGPWTAWVNALADGTLQHAPNDYVQVKLTMTRSGDDDPSVDKVVVSFDGQASATLLAGDFSPGGQFFFAQLLDYFVVVNGIDAPRKYDGSTLSLLGGFPPHASYVAAHKNRLWMARGSRLYFSDLLDIESWPVLNFIDIAPQDGDTITGLLPYGDYLVITKQRSTWLLTGDGINTFAVRRIHADRGAYAPRSLCIVNQMLCFISDDGIYFSDFTQPVLISERIRQTWNKLNKRRLNLAASWFAEHKLYVAVPDSDSQRNNLVIVYDTIRQAFAGLFTGWNAACWCDFREAGEIHTYFGCSDTGQVRRINVGYSDANQAFTARWESKHLTFGAPEIFKRWNRNLFQVKPADQNAALRVRFVVDGVETSSMTICVPADSTGFIHTLLVLASAVGVIGGHRIGVKVEQDVLDNPLGIQTIYIESMPITLHPTLRG